MSQFAKIEWPVCPECSWTMNDPRIFTLQDLTPSQFFCEKRCLHCEKQFLMRTKVVLQTEVERIEQEKK